MKIKKLCAALLIFALIAIHKPLISSEVQRNLTFERGFICHPDQPEARIEFFYLMPNGPGPFPVLFLLAGWQPEENSKGGKQLAEYGYLHHLVAEGIAAVSISVPGFGNTDGKRDFGGPYSQSAVCAVLDHFKAHPNIDPTKMGIYGISRGAALGSMVSSLYPGLKVQILESGFYDLLTSPWPMPSYLNGIRDNLLREAGDTQEALMVRSAVYHADKIRAATLILHGEFDDRRGLDSAKSLHENLKRYGVESRLKIYPNAMHCLTLRGSPSVDKMYEEIIPFLRFYFFNTCGIGIRISDPLPAIQITEILPGFPAALSGKLRVGDALLRMSPHNDATEIDVFRMPKQEFIPLVLGKPGTSVRLHVQHFDQTYEDIVIERSFWK